MKGREELREDVLSKTAVIAGLVFFSLLAAVIIHRKLEAHYDGKPISFWIGAMYDVPTIDPTDSLPVISYFKVNQALLELGTNSAPAVARALLAPSSKLASFYSNVYFRNRFRFPPWLAKVLPRPKFPGLVRNRADRLLRDMGTNAFPAVPILVGGLTVDDLNTRRDCAEILGRIGSKAEAAVPALIKSLEDSDPMVRGSAAAALAKIGCCGEKTIPALLTALFMNRISKFEAIEALRALGYDGTEVTQKPSH